MDVMADFGEEHRGTTFLEIIGANKQKKNINTNPK
jgi:hypothetical protein